MSIEVSVIIPSYNKYPLNQLTLYSLAKQTFDPSKMEVIFVDDGSTDETKQTMSDINLPFVFNYIYINKNMGRSKARNLGIESARGRILIFLDAELIVEPDFIENHYRHHMRKKGVVVSGGLYLKRIFTFLYPNFNGEQRWNLYSCINREKLEVLGKPFAQLKNIGEFTKYVTKLNNPLRLIEKKEIDTGFYKKLSYSAPYLSEVVAKYGQNLTHYHLPWTTFLSGNVSLEKCLLNEVGCFDYTFNGWGFEDWDLGYRLYKHGASFINDPSIQSYHQEHPYSLENRQKNMYKNYLIYKKKHQVFEVSVLPLVMTGKINYLDESEIIGEYKRLCVEYPKRFQTFLTVILSMLETMAVLLAEGKKVDKLEQKVGLLSNMEFKSQVEKEREELIQLGKFNRLAATFDLLVKL